MQLTSYAQQKFELLNNHQVYIREEQLEEVIALPDSLKKRGKHYFAKKDGIGVVYVKDSHVIRVVTFYPLKK